MTSQRPGIRPLVDGRSDLRDVLHANGPHPTLGDAGSLFDRFVGRWDVSYTHFRRDGSVAERYPGQVTFGWVLGGRAMQDLWLGTTPDTNETSVGTTIRFLDPQTNVWTVVWIDPEASVVAALKGGQVGDRIVLDGISPDGWLRRWSFNDIEGGRFTWRGERSDDDGETWWLTAEYHFTRDV